eukprot:TRINITY_DN15223_c0_g1_i2.p1 TRINITY_DN15223_c0_g1~~TRINITY_DN15223_c0_g1_i2.p1  ORF type:complete len:133 (-),score=21.31 TRINITY_DN15223_c0_g1_i2:160-558(-)
MCIRDRQGTGVLLRDDHSKYGYTRLAVGYLAGTMAGGAFLLGRDSFSKPDVPRPTTQLTASWNPIHMAKHLGQQYPPVLLRYYGVNFLTSAVVAGLGCSVALKYVVGHPAEVTPEPPQDTSTQTEPEGGASL